MRARTESDTDGYTYCNIHSYTNADYTYGNSNGNSGRDSYRNCDSHIYTDSYSNRYAETDADAKA